MKNCFSRIVQIFLIATLLTACNSVKDLVNKKFPPINAEEHRATAIMTAYATLQQLKEPDVAAEIDVNIIQDALNSNQKLTEYNIKNVELSADKQLLFIKVSIDGKFSSAMFEDLSSDQAKLLDRLSPEVAGTINFGGSITSNSTTGAESQLEMKLRFLPIFKEVKIEKLEVAENVDLEKPADFVFDIVNKLADNITGEISRQEFTKISFPAFPVDALKTSFSDSQQGDDGTLIDINVNGKPITSPNYLKAMALKIHDQRVTLIAQLASTSSELPTQNNDGVSRKFSEFSSLYDNSLKHLISPEERPKNIWAALSKLRLSELLNSGFQQAKLCVGAQALIPKQEFSEQIKIPDETGISCSSTRNCTPSGSCEQAQDCRQTNDCRQTENCSQTANCRACLLRAPRICAFGGCTGGQCIQSGNDPICEARKVARRADCEARKTARRTTCEAGKVAARNQCEAGKVTRKLDCERLKSQKKLQCEGEKAGEKALCETGKETLKRLSRTGKIANVNGFAQANGQMRLCFNKVRFDSEMKSLDLGIEIRGKADAKVGIKWMPLDILGHAVCPIKWTEDKDLTVTVPKQDVDLRTELEFNHKDGSLEITGNLETSELKVELKPGPRDLILKNYNMQLACPLIGALSMSSAPLVISVSEFIPEMKGKFVFPENKQELSFTVDPLDIEIPDSSKIAEAKIVSAKKAFIAEVKLK